MSETSTAYGCDACGGTGGQYTHAADCDSDHCVGNGDMYSCSGSWGPCDCVPTDEQPMPTAGRQDVTPMARQSFVELLDRRERKGIETYGTTLQTHNGRDAFQDAMEEAVDLWQYLIQARAEHADALAQIERLTAERDAYRHTAERHLDAARRLEEVEREHADCATTIRVLIQQRDHPDVGPPPDIDPSILGDA